ncbi:MAG: hypothetical protein AAB383_05560 [Patescibacteria group bacterium]
MRRLAPLSLVLLLSACSLIAPYNITFTTPKDSVVDPATDTLDFVVSAATLAYISEVECDDADDIDLLPVVTDEMGVKTAHNLALTMLNGAPGAECEVTVTAFDQSTTATARATTTVVIFGEPVEEPVVEEVPVVETPVEEEVTVETTVEAEAEVLPVEETPAE